MNYLLEHALHDQNLLLFQVSMPDLYSHFQYNGIETHMYASQWFLTLFTAKFPLPMVYYIMDLFLCHVSQLYGMLGHAKGERGVGDSLNPSLPDKQV